MRTLLIFLSTLFFVARWQLLILMRLLFDDIRLITSCRSPAVRVGCFIAINRTDRKLLLDRGTSLCVMALISFLFQLFSAEE